MKQWIRTIGRLAASTLLAVAAAGALAQPAAPAAFPTKTVRIILPYAAGGGADALARTVAQRLSELWKQPVIVDNRPGAGAIIGTDAVAKAAPDGYTLLLAAGTIAVSPTAYPKLPFNVFNDLVPIGTIARSAYVLVTKPSLNVKTVADLVKLAKAQPGKLNAATPGNGTLAHLAFEMLRNETGMQATVVHYKGSNPALADVLSGQTDFVFDTPAAVMPHVKAGKLDALAVTTRQRLAEEPQLPTMIEAGVPDFDVSVWYAFFAPAGTPAALVQKIHADLQTALTTPAVVQQLNARGQDVFLTRPDEFATYLRAEVAKWADLIKKAKIQFEQ